MSLLSIIDELAYAQALMKEARRHRLDAESLDGTGRYAAGIASLHKASELAVKAWITVNGGTRYWNAMYATHKPITSVEGGKDIWRSLTDAIEQQHPGILARVKALESLESSKPGKYTYAEELNAEYPFVHFVGTVMHVEAPGDIFGKHDFDTHANMVDDLHRALTILCPDLA